MRFAWPFGGTEQSFEVPDRLLLETVTGERVPPLSDLGGALRGALEKPVASPHFRQLFRPGDKVLAVVPDYHRMWVRTSAWLPLLLNELNRAGVSDRDIELLVATGTHPRPSWKELLEMLGERVMGRVRVSVHDARDPAGLARMGESAAGTPIHINRLALSGRRVILTGGVVPHAFAGFGGGRKAVVPGIAGMRTILANHRLALHPQKGGGIHPLAAPGVLDGNPVSEDMEDIASRINPSFIVNFALSEEGDFLGVFAGHWKEAHRAGCRFVEEAFRVPVRGKADIVVASRGGHPMDLTFYQAFQSHANAQAVLKPGGVLIMVGECSEGVGGYDFERWFDLGGPEAIEEELRREFTVPGFVVYRAALLARRVRRLILVSGLPPETVRRIGITPHPTIDCALREAWSLLPEGEVTLMPHASQTIPSLPEDRLRSAYPEVNR